MIHLMGLSRALLVHRDALDVQKSDPLAPLELESPLSQKAHGLTRKQA